MSELNPNHPVTQLTRDQWHKITAVIMHKLGLSEIELTANDVQNLADSYPDGTPCIVADARAGRFVVRLISGREAEFLAREEKRQLLH